MKGAAWTVPALMVATAAPAYASSCQAGKWTAVGRGKLLSGGLFDVNLDTVLGIDGTIAAIPNSYGETGYVHGQGTTHPADPDIHHNPLSLTALGSINVSATGLTAALSSILNLVTPAELGTINQFGYAESVGISQGASGYVDDSGTLRATPETGYPTFASLDLKKLLTPVLGTGATNLLGSIVNLNLEVGAVMGRAVLEQQCNTQVWPTGYSLERDYLLAHLRMVLESPLVGDVVTTLASVVDDAINDFPTSLVFDALAAAVAAFYYPGLGNIATRQGRMGIDTTLVTGQIPAGNTQPIQMNLGQGTVVIDLSTLLSNNADPFGAAYSPWLNGRDANTVLFVDYPLPGTALSTFAQGVATSLEDIVLDLIYVEVRQSSSQPWTRHSLRDLLSIGGLVGTALTTLINTVNGLILGTLVTAAVGAVSNVLGVVFGWLETLVNITINEQNIPAANVPPKWGTKAGPGRWSPAGSQPLPAGRYDVAAIGLHVLNVLPGGEGGLDLFLARAGVGPHVGS